MYFYNSAAAVFSQASSHIIIFHYPIGRHIKHSEILSNTHVKLSFNCICSKCFMNSCCWCAGNCCTASIFVLVFGYWCVVRYGADSVVCSRVEGWASWSPHRLANLAACLLCGWADVMVNDRPSVRRWICISRKTQNIVLLHVRLVVLPYLLGQLQ